jgi:hypothetical protein
MRMVVCKHQTSLSLLFLAICVIAQPFVAQSQACGSGGPVDKNNWRQVPVPAHAHPDTVSAEDRKARDEYWTTAMPILKSGDSDYPNFDQISGSSMAGTEGPAAYDPTRYWVIGTFLGHDVHEVSGKTIYTEIHLRIDSVLGTHEKPNSPKVGSVIDFGIGGG